MAALTLTVGGTLWACPLTLQDSTPKAMVWGPHSDSVCLPSWYLPWPPRQTLRGSGREAQFGWSATLLVQADLTQLVH